MAVPAEPQVSSAPVAAADRADVDVVQQHRPQSQTRHAAGLAAHLERGLPDDPQDVERQRRKGEDEFVHRERSARKPLHVQVRLQFAVELLVRGVFVVEADDRVGVVGKVRPPERDLDVGEKHVVRLRLDHLVDAEERTVLRALRLHVRDDAAPDRHVRSLLVVPVGLRRAVRIALRLFGPAPRALAARVALDDERKSVRRPRTGRGHRGKEVVEFEAGPDRVVRVVSRVKTDEQPLRGEQRGHAGGPLEERDEVLLRMLFARAQFVGELEAVRAERREDRRVAVDPVVGEADALLPAVVVDEDRDVHVERHVGSAGRADGPEVLRAAQQVEIEVVHDVADAGDRGDDAEPLTEGRLGRHIAADRVGEQVVPLMRGDVGEGCLAEGHERDLGLHERAVGIALEGNRPRGLLPVVKPRESAHPIEQLLGKENARVGADILR